MIYEGQIQDVKDLGFVDRFGEGEVKGVDSFDCGEAGLEDAGFDEPLLSGGDFLGGQDVEEGGVEALRYWKGTRRF